MSAVRSKVGYVLLIAAPLLAALGYYCASHAGCYFEPKQGIGDFQSAEPWSLAGLGTVALAWLSLAIGVPLATRPTVPVFLGSLLLTAILTVPLGMLMLMAAESSGTIACGP
ncbi:MAG: hypothetical protein EOO81_08320 [Oxalobacteraceae bacterium]|nr:MAG: hypothetical protein EOO81_08320 [Oxalobacteraceae bacterium]